MYAGWTQEDLDEIEPVETIVRFSDMYHGPDDLPEDDPFYYGGLE